MEGSIRWLGFFSSGAAALLILRGFRKKTTQHRKVIREWRQSELFVDQKCVSVGKKVLDKKRSKINFLLVSR